MKINKLFELKNNFNIYKDVKSVIILGKLHNTHPEFSILIPTFGRLTYLEEAIDSAINQTAPKNKYEIIIVDNDPEPNLEIENMIKLKKCSNLIYYKNSLNIGMVGNWNRCIELSSGKWITFLHDDDLFEDNYIKKMHFITNKHPHYSLIAPTAQILQSNPTDTLIKKRISNKFVELKISDFIYGNPVPTQGTMFDRKLAIQLGGFYEKWWPGMDWVFWINFIRKYNGILIKDKLLIYRKHSEAESSKIETKKENIELKINIQDTLESYRTPLQSIYSYFLKRNAYLLRYKSYSLFYKIVMYSYYLAASFHLFLRQKNQ